MRHKCFREGDSRSELTIGPAVAQILTAFSAHSTTTAKAAVALLWEMGGVFGGDGASPGDIIALVLV